MLNERGGLNRTHAARIADEYYLAPGSRSPRIVIPSTSVWKSALDHGSRRLTVWWASWPNSRKLLNELTDADLSLKAFPFSSAQWQSIANTNVLMLRITYVGELGWELHMRMDQVRVCSMRFNLFVKYGLHGDFIDQLAAHGKGLPRLACGGDSGDTPYEAGLGFMVKLDKTTTSSARTRY
jgi:hypothetical protein